MLLPKFKHIHVDSGCQCACHGCTVWQKLPLFEPISKAVLNATKLAFISGADPLTNPATSELLLRLKKQKAFTILASPGLTLSSLPADIIRCIDLPIIFLPGYDQASIREYMGRNVYNQLISSLQYLVELNRKFIVVYPLEADDPSVLPVVYEQISKLPNAYLCLLQTDTQPAHTHIKYYTNKKNVLHLRTKIDKNYCQCAPPALLKLRLRNILFLAKLLYKLYF